jgi:hypothetical protein
MLESYRKEFLDLLKLVESKHVARLSVSKNIMYQDIEERYEKIKYDTAAKLEELKIISDTMKYTSLLKQAKIHDHFIECELEKATTKICKIYSSSMKKLIPYQIKRAEWFFKQGKINDAFDVWESILKNNPDNEFIHLQIDKIKSNDYNALKYNIISSNYRYIKERALNLSQKYRFVEDKSFMTSLRETNPIGPVRCIEFDKFGCIYLNDVSRACIIKISDDNKMEWQLSADEWTFIHKHFPPLGFGSFTTIKNKLMVTDFRSRHLVFIDFHGRLINKIKLPLECPSFSQFVSVKNKFHIPDETIGVIAIFNSKFNMIGSYRHKDERFKPVQILWLQEKEMILAAFGNQSFASRIEAFNLEGRHLFTFASFDENPCHVVKFAIDEHYNVFAVDHYGKIYKFDFNGNLIWTFSEEQRFDRFKYVKYHDSYLYISDAFIIRRFRVN